LPYNGKFEYPIEKLEREERVDRENYPERWKKESWKLDQDMQMKDFNV
jgi:hypothetical protein